MTDNIMQFLLFPESSLLFVALKYIALAFSFFFLGFFVFFLFKTKWFKLLFWYDFIEFFTMKIYGGVFAGFKWKWMQGRAKNAKEENYAKFAICGHKIMDKLLKRLAPVYQADSYGERLARCGVGTFSNITDIWWAHELYLEVTRKKIVMISREDFEKLINTYNQAFKELRII